VTGEYQGDSSSKQPWGHATAATGEMSMLDKMPLHIS
jgi:hypothetical protein